MRGRLDPRRLLLRALRKHPTHPHGLLGFAGVHGRDGLLLGFVGAVGPLPHLPSEGACPAVRRVAEQDLLSAPCATRGAGRRGAGRLCRRTDGAARQTARGSLAGWPRREGGGPRPPSSASSLGRQAGNITDPTPDPLLCFPRGGATTQRPDGGRPSAGAADRAAKSCRATRRGRGDGPTWRRAVPASGPSVPRL